MSDCVTPLEPNTSKCGYTWLIQGTTREQRRIDGFTGLSWGLMHYFVKITHLCSRMLKHPSSGIVRSVGSELEKQLENFWQWSELSGGFPTSQDLLDSARCELDENGKVTTAAKVTELVAESYVAAAQIYLRCRLFRFVNLVHFSRFLSTAPSCFFIFLDALLTVACSTAEEETTPSSRRSLTGFC
jgi:hypothetical protein